MNVIVQYQGLLNLIVSNQGTGFTLKFWSTLCYFLDIKQKHFIAFYSQINSQTKRQNSTIEAYFYAFINFKQNN